MNKAIQELRGSDPSDLKAKLADLRKEQWQLRFKGPEQGSRPTRQREIRRTIARILTVLGERAGASATSK